jgi:hypothetical protein
MSSTQRKITLNEAGEALTKNLAVSYDATDKDVVHPDSGESDAILGVVERAYDSGESNLQIVIEGPAKIAVGGSLPFGSEFTFDSNNKAIPIVSAEQRAVGVYDQPKLDSNNEPRTLVSGESHTLTLYANKKARPLAQALRSVQFEFDATGGKAIGTHDLGIDLPAGAVLLYSHYEVITTFTSATDAATIALTAGSGTIKGAVAISNGANPWDDGLKDGAHTWAASAAQKLSAVGAINAVVAVEALTAGKLIGELVYALHPEA